jgi:DNA-binding transcriptional regulator YhcF (GntR family)
LDLLPLARVADWGQWKASKADKLDPDEVPTELLVSATRRGMQSKGAAHSAPKDGAIVPYRSAYAAAGRGEWQWQWPRRVTTLPYERGRLPSHDLWERMGKPRIQYEPEDRAELWSELFAKGHTRVLDTSEAGGGKTTDMGLWLQELQAQFDRDYAIEQTDHGAGKRARAILLDPDHRNPSTPSTKALTDFPSKHTGLVMSKEGKIRVASPNTKPEDLIEWANCPSAEIHHLLAKDGEITPIGPSHPVCAACPEMAKKPGGQWSCPITKEIHQARAGGAWIGHPAAVPVDEGDVVAVDEADRSITTERSRHTQWPEKEWGQLQWSSPALYTALQSDGVRAAQDRLMNLAAKSKYGLSAVESRAAFLGALPKSEDAPLFDPWGDGGAIAQSNRSLSETNRVFLAMLGSIEGNPTDQLLPNAEDLKIPVSPTRTVQTSRLPQDPVDLIRSLGGRALDVLRSLAGRASNPDLAREAIADTKSVRAIADLLSFTRTDRRAPISCDGNSLTITTPDHTVSRKLQRARFVLLADATANRKETSSRFGFGGNLIEIQANPSRFEGKLRICNLTGAGNFGVDRRDESEHCAANRAEYLKAQFWKIHPDGAVFDSLPNLTGEGLEGAFFRDSRKTNAFEGAPAILVVGKPVPNLMAMASKFTAHYGLPVEDPVGRWDFKATNKIAHRRYCQWLHREVIKEAVQTLARLRAQRGQSEKLVYTVDWPEWLVKGVLAYFADAAYETKSVHQFCPEAAPKGSQTERKVVQAIVSDLKEGIKPTINRVAEKLQVAKSTVSKAVKGLTGLDFKKSVEGFLLLLRAPDNKWKLEDLPPEAQNLAEILRRLAINLLDGAITPDDVREAIAEAYIESGETLTEQAITALPARERRALRAIIDRTSLIEWLNVETVLYGRARVSGGRAIEQLDDRELAALAVQRSWPLSQGGIVGDD